MVTRKELWVANDGEEFDTEQAAFEHEVENEVGSALVRVTGVSLDDSDVPELLADESFCRAMYQWANRKYSTVPALSLDGLGEKDVRANARRLFKANEDAYFKTLEFCYLTLVFARAGGFGEPREP